MKTSSIVMILAASMWLFGAIDAIVIGDNGLAVSGSEPDGVGQLEASPALFQGGVDSDGRTFFLNGQPAKSRKLLLTASNGFFDNDTCRAGGESDLPKVGDDALIKPNYAYLDQWKKTDGAIRWHVWISRPGQIRLNVYMRVAEAEAGSQLTVSLAGTSHSVTTAESDADQPQPWGLTFDVKQPGEHTLSLSAIELGNSRLGVGQLHRIAAFGPAIDDAQLLRARWRPAAVHGSYSNSKIAQSRMWVMTTRSMSDFSSYSPITTPFGYYGTSFEADRRTQGGFNFSMWAAGSGKAVPSLVQMPHLLAAGSPQAEFSGFGHEGSGVKLRRWTPMPDRPRLCIQALRVESDGNYDTYYGYFWDNPKRQWKLYAVGRKWNRGRPAMNLLPGSFCEVPGPPHVQRSGDRVREVRRRGWHLDEGGTWHAMDTFNCKSKGPSNKFWYTTNDGEFAMGTGGMRYYAFERPAVPKQIQTLPEFLTPESTDQLYRLPARIDQIKTVNITSTTAEVSLSVSDAGTNASVAVFYGESDCLTFAKRELHGTELNSAVSQSTQADNRSWSQSTSPVRLKAGSNLVRLTNLKASTVYYYRALITNEEGKLWSYHTVAFETK